MRKRPYYSVRTGKHPTGGKLHISDVKRLFLSEYLRLSGLGRFQEVFGHDCVDAGHIAGTAGADIDSFIFAKLKKRHLWPINEDRLGSYEEDDLFDIIELLHDCVSKGVKGFHHTWGECGWHYETFGEPVAAQQEYRDAINAILSDYERPHEVTKDGEVVEQGPRGLRGLLQAPKPPGDPNDVQARVEAAIDKFRHRGASTHDRRDALKNLADILEFLRPQAKNVLMKKDEADLFELVNSFGIRHHNQQQKTDYDPLIWQSWMFYYLLAAIHATTRLIEKASTARTDRAKKSEVEPR
jgi:hypothetical protein